MLEDTVVLYRFSTSNHNLSGWKCSRRVVVLYRFSTSNHNLRSAFISLSLLYYIVSLHQTTTVRLETDIVKGCIISFLYIKPQQGYVNRVVQWRCIISFLYIKPQLIYWMYERNLGCIISFLYIKPQPKRNFAYRLKSCIISFLYIKPQLLRR